MSRKELSMDDKKSAVEELCKFLEKEGVLEKATDLLATQEKLNNGENVDLEDLINVAKSALSLSSRRGRLVRSGTGIDVDQVKKHLN